MRLRFIRERTVKFCNCCNSDRILNMEIMLSHIDIGVANNTLNCRKVNTQGLHLADIGMSTGMGAEVSYPFNCFQSLLVLRTEIRRVISFPVLHYGMIATGNR